MALGVEEGREERSLGVFVLLLFFFVLFFLPYRERHHFFPLARTRLCGHTHVPGELGKTV